MDSRLDGVTNTSERVRLVVCLIAAWVVTSKTYQPILLSKKVTKNCWNQRTYNLFRRIHKIFLKHTILIAWNFDLDMKVQKLEVESASKFRYDKHFGRVASAVSYCATQADVITATSWLPIRINDVLGITGWRIQVRANVFMQKSPSNINVTET